jgi:hypothetical protein
MGIAGKEDPTMQSTKVVVLAAGGKQLRGTILRVELFVASITTAY